MYQVKKRNGDICLFDLNKVKQAMKKTFESCNRNYQDSIIDMLSLKAIANAETKIKDSVLNVEDIQDSVESTLMAAGYEDVAKAYILYRKQHERNRKAKETVLDYKKTIEGYTKAEDWRVKENASIEYSLGGLILGNSGAVTANYWLSEIYDDEIANAHRNCDIHIHDLSMLSAYCNGGSLKQLIQEGLGGVPKKISSKPASHLSTLCNQIVNFMGVLSLEFAGAQALSSVDTLLAPFVKVDDLSYHEVKQCIQSLVFGLNTPSRWGCVPITTQIATPGGFKYYNELNTGDTIYTFVDGKLKTAKLNNIIVKKNESGKLHKYCGNNYVQTVTPEHRCIICLEDGGFRIIRSEAIKKFLSENQTIYMPVVVVDNDGTISITDNQCIKIDSVDVLDYSEMVWCPSTDDGTAIYRDTDGNTFISGNCQPVFSNFTIDWVVPDDLAEMNCIVGGEEQNFKYKDCKREMDMINKAFLEVMVEGDADGRSFSYPILTYSITKDFDWDEESVNNKLLFEMTAKYGIPYFSNYINSDMKPSDSRSMCPLHKDERVLVRDRYSNEFHISKIGDLYCGNKHDNEYDIVLNGEIKTARLNKFDGLDFYKIETVNGYSVILSANHLNLVLGGNVKQTCDLTTNDYLPFNISELDGAGLSYDDGFMVGAYFGDGSLKDDYCIVYSLNRESKAEVLSKVIDLATNKYGAKVKLYDIVNGVGDRGCVNVSIISRYLRGLISEYVSGKALDKELNAKCITRSVEFRKGIVDGYMKTDGGNRNRIYTASKKAVESVSTLFESLGTPCRITVDDRDRSETLSDNPVYTIRPYSINSKQSCRKDTFIKKDGYMWFKIKSVEKFETVSKIGYCFEVLDDETPYFMLPSGLVTHNCRLRLDLRELRRKNGGYFGSGDGTGSVGVTTINMPRLAYLSENEEDFYRRLENLMNICSRSLEIKRRVVTQLLQDGLYPYTKRYVKHFDNHFSTIATNGMNEMCLNAKWIKDDIASEKGYQFAKDVLEFMRNKLSDYQEQTGNLYNLESAPAESVCHRFALHDKRDFPDIITAGDNTDGAPYYTNSSNLPVDYTDDIFEALDHQDELQTKYTGGTVFHAFLGERLPNWKSAMMLTKKIAENYKLPYFTFSPTYSICKNHGYLVGEQWKCPHCGEPTEVYSRVTGYYRAVQNFNDGKAHEFKDRKEYKITEDSLKSNTAVVENDTVNTTKETQVYELDKPVLITTETCPNCKIVKEYIKEFDFDCDIIIANEHLDFVRSLNINQAPTLVVPDGDGNIRLIANASNIRKYLEENS